MVVLPAALVRMAVPADITGMRRVRIATKIIDMFQIIIVYDVHLTELAEQGRIKMIPVFAKLACGMMVQIVTSVRVVERRHTQGI